MSERAARELVRCTWVGDDPEMVRYHDEEWGVPAHDDRHLFEMLTLEGAQAGLSWRTILHKRSGYRAAFANFDAAKVSRFDARKVEVLLRDPGIVRNRLKVESTISNAKALLALQREEGSLDRFVWSFVGERPRVNRPETMRAIATRTSESDALSKALKKRGFRFVGTTIMYAFMQACGLVDDHVATCFRARSRAPK
jgi:DNA-3-methyladenine glycosylase I